MKPLRRSNASSAAPKSTPAEWAKRRSSTAAWSRAPEIARNASNTVRFSASIGGPPRRGGRVHGGRDPFRCGCLGAPAPEARETGLRLLADLACASAETRAEIGIFSDFARLVRTEIGAADGDRIFRPETEFLARSVG